MNRYWIPVRKNSINIINRSLESNLKGFFYKNTKTTIPDLENNLHESQPLGYAYETDSHFVHFYGQENGLNIISVGLTAIQGNISKQLAKLNTIVIGISPDNTSRLKKFETRDNLSIQLLSDEDHKVADLYGVWGEKKFMGKVYDGIHRISFFIDIEGKIQKVFNGFKTKEHHNLVLEYTKQFET